MEELILSKIGKISSIVVDVPFAVHFVFNETEGVKYVCDDKHSEYLKFDHSLGKLNISLSGVLPSDGCLNPTVYLCTELDLEVVVKQSSYVLLWNLPKMNNLSLTSSANGILKVADSFDASTINVTAHNKGSIIQFDCTCYCDNLNVEISNLSSLYSFALQCKIANVKIADCSNVTINCTQKLNYLISECSSLAYKQHDGLILVKEPKSEGSLLKF